MGDGVHDIVAVAVGEGVRDALRDRVSLPVADSVVLTVMELVHEEEGEIVAVGVLDSVADGSSWMHTTVPVLATVNSLLSLLSTRPVFNPPANAPAAMCHTVPPSRSRAHTSPVLTAIYTVPAASRHGN